MEGVNESGEFGGASSGEVGGISSGKPSFGSFFASLKKKPEDISAAISAARSATFMSKSKSLTGISNDFTQTVQRFIDGAATGEDVLGAWAPLAADLQHGESMLRNGADFQIESLLQQERVGFIRLAESMVAKLGITLDSLKPRASTHEMTEFVFSAQDRANEKKTDIVGDKKREDRRLFDRDAMVEKLQQWGNYFQEQSFAIKKQQEILKKQNVQMQPNKPAYQ